MRFGVLAALLALPLAGQTRVDFVRDIRPIFAEKCIVCHGPDDKTRMANLRLDTRDGALAARDKILPRITTSDPAQRMPMGGPPLSTKQVEAIRAWIADGMPWEKHWSFVPPARAEVPAGKKNPIDYFIQARLKKESLGPAPPADKTTQIRRVTLDLTGLPPTPAEVDAFLADHSAGAYEKVVDRLLHSPHYGERMAMPWLDLARYADTHGYHIDSHRDMWPWRDWVIDAFNRNLPFDQFTVWQVAGDLLPSATREQRLASGFNRNHMINYEGGAIPEEYLVEYAVDRVEATASAWMGLTMGCARCHDHKYDPITQKEFYRFYAFFNNVADQGLDGKKGNAEPLMRLTTPEQDKRFAEIETSLKAIDKSLAPTAIEPMQTAWEKTRLSSLPFAPRDGLVAHYEFDNNLSDISGHYQPGRVISGEVSYTDSPAGRAVSLGGEAHLELGRIAAFRARRPFTIATWIRSGGVHEMAVLQQLDSAANGRGVEILLGESRPLPHLRRASRLEVRLGDRKGEGIILRSREPLLMSGQDGSSPWHHYTVSWDGSGKAAGLRVLVDAKPIEMEIVQDELTGEIDNNSSLTSGNPALARASDVPFQGALDDLRVYDRLLSAAEIKTLVVDEPVRAVLWSGPAASRRSSMQKTIVREDFLTRGAPENLRRLFAERNALLDERTQLEYSIPSVMTMAEGKKLRESFVLARGDYANPTEKVTPGIPAALPALPEDTKADRLTLARWLVDPANPLTARVTVNRFWQMYFGTGLVKTAEDFGARGELPSHPELLDWLATEFVRSGWDVRAMQRLIVTSDAYRQNSHATPAAIEKDPENRLLARGPRFRLPAELVRDNALAASGLLNPKTGGPSVYPYQPDGLWEEISFGDVYSSQYYAQGHGEDLYRRSMYTFWKRTSPPPSLAIFDAPDRQKCVARRSRTNTPLQALVLMNDPTYVEASRALAARVILAEKSTAGRIRLAFRLAAARSPAAGEEQSLASLATKELAHYRGNSAAAEKLLHVGESPVDPRLNKTELAAWTTVAQVILSMDETISR